MFKIEKTFAVLVLFFVFAFFLTGCQIEQPNQTAESGNDVDYQRIISLSGAITETLFYLGYGKQIVGVDFPPSRI